MNNSENSIEHLSLDLYNFVHNLLKGNEILLEQYPKELKKPLLKLFFSVYQATLLREDTPHALNQLFKISTDVEVFLEKLEEWRAHSIMVELLNHVKSIK